MTLPMSLFGLVAYVSVLVRMTFSVALPVSVVVSMPVAVGPGLRIDFRNYSF
jgi:hypothetical protein